MDDRFLRQQDAVNMERLQNLSVTLIGAGSIGSTTALWLGKMGVGRLIIFDNDYIEQHNWSNQVYREADVGRLKVDALAEILNTFTGLHPEVHPIRYDGSRQSEVVISGVDSMASRKEIWRLVRDSRLYLDARMGLETLIVYAVNPRVKDDRVRYVKTLYNDAEALQEPCTARTICYTPLMAAAVLCNLVKRYANQVQLPGQIVLDLATYTAMSG